MQTTGSPTKILGAREENEQLFINQGTTIIITMANSFNIDFPTTIQQLSLTGRQVTKHQI